MRRVYISGPMTGHPAHNYPAFFDAERRWSAMGWAVANPARNFGGRTDLPRDVYMRADFHHLLSVDAIAMLPGWDTSQGAMSELNKARELALEVFDAMTALPYDAHVRLSAVVPE